MLKYWHSSKESAFIGDVGDAWDVGYIPGSERSLRGGNGNPLQYSCLENLVDRGAWWATGYSLRVGCEDPSNWSVAPQLVRVIRCGSLSAHAYINSINWEQTDIKFLSFVFINMPFWSSVWEEKTKQNIYSFFFHNDIREKYFS